MSQPLVILSLTPTPPPYKEGWSRPDLCFPHCSTADHFKTLLDSQPPDLILSDFSLPGLDLQTVRAHLAEAQLDIPLIAIPEKITEQSVVQFMSAGAADCIASGETEHLKLALDRELKNLLLHRALREKRRAAVRSLSSRLAHDFNNILAPVSMSAPMLKWDLEDAEFDEIVDTLEQTTRTGAETIHHLHVFGRGIDLDRRDTPAGELLQAIAADFVKTLPANTTLEMEAPKAGLSISIDREKFKQSLLSILENAREAMPGGGAIKIQAGEKSTPPEFFLSVSDQGEGMDAPTLEQVFDPFFSTKRNVRKGAGLGLSLALGIVKSHGGDIRAESRPGKGSTFRITLPLPNK